MPGTFHPGITAEYLRATHVLGAAHCNGEISDEVFDHRRNRIETWLAEREIMVPGGFSVEWKIPGQPIKLEAETPTFS